ncbi:uncharacterized protein AMSG_10713 [Thecamonas trahens ATCC 50062]|uniref:Uncharacterized protein n=1 Tax=Thecamonas trahens ATCC 50062 TaxID=461836 RepID=A0A0L0DUI0_THETB|nr:hypothetical protein AMSG_10713 [Thecamonas trahens ATCC 50062]KNC55113.1 hypothetical protein AMSG_10713 [Thecamonas trahens ATCC 50062]|eukprot:XP_013753295.1 hypothetical protein AMSG_10713 [Thecamonas trahens ATCC 50062]
MAKCMYMPSTTLVLLVFLVALTTSSRASQPPACVSDLTVTGEVIDSGRNGITAAALGLIDSDGWLDAVAAFDDEGTISWYKNTDGAGTFAPPVNVVTGITSIRKVAVVDVDDDGWNDVVFGQDSSSSGFIAWARSTDGSGAFAAPVTITACNDFDDFVLGDVDNDGDDDLVAACPSSGDVFFVERLTGGSFASAITITDDFNGPSSVGLGDFNQDGALDVVFSAAFVDTLVLALGSGDGNFGPSTVVYSDIDSPKAVAVGDFNSDGLADFAAVGGGDDTVLWFRNTGNGSFAPPTTIASLYDAPRDLAVVDMNGDGIDDVILCTTAGTLAVFYVLDENGKFGGANVVDSRYAPMYRIATGDVDGDTRPDIVIGSTHSHSQLRLFRNNPVQAASYSPDASVTPSVSPTLVTGFDGIRDLVVADVDADGLLDIVASASNIDMVAWARQLPSGRGFGATTIISLSIDGVRGIDVADVDADGDVDVVSTATLASKIFVHTNVDGAGGRWSTAELASNFGDPRSIVLADLDGDALLDIVSGAMSSGVVAWFRNTGTGTGALRFSAPITVATLSPGPGDIIVADVDGSGAPDIVTMAYESSGGDAFIAWLPNLDGAGSFGSPVFLPPGIYTGQHGIAVAAADFDGDNDTDLVAASLWQNAVAWYDNLDGLGSAWSETVLSTSLDGAIFVAGADIDADGDQDIVACAEYGDDVGYFVNSDGAGSFAPFLLVSYVAYSPRVVRVVDLDGDSDLDLVVASSTSDGVAWFPGRTRNAWTTVRVPTSLSMVYESRACGVDKFSLLCLLDNIRRTSLCVRDTLLLEPGVYSCRGGAHASIGRTLTLAPRVPGTVSFDCDGGVLFLVTASPTFVEARGDVEIRDVELTRLGQGSHGIEASPGIRISGDGARLVLTSVSIRESKTENLPGQVYVDEGLGGVLLAVSGGRLEVNNSTIEQTSTTGAGGAIACRGVGSSVLASHSRIASCSASERGGGLAVVDGGSAVLHQSVVESNTASSGGGGGIYVSGTSTLKVTGGEIRGNSGGGAGGGILVAATGRGELLGVTVRGNSGGSGGGLAVASEAVASAVAILQSAADMPRADPSADSYVGPGPESTAALVLTDVSVVDNVARMHGGGASVCGGRVVISGTSSRWAGNAAQRTPVAMRSSADVFVCAPSASWTGAASRESADSLPWLRIAPAVFGGGMAGAAIHGPPAALEWASAPSRSLQAGEPMSGRVRARDWLGEPVVYTGVQLRMRFPSMGSGLGIVEAPQPTTFTESSPIPAVRLGAMSAESVPVDVAFTVEVSGAGGALPVASVGGQVAVTACRGGFGVESLVTADAADVVLGCRACDAGTGAVAGFNTCGGIPECAANTARINTTGLNAGSVEPCFCLPGFWSESGESDVACVGCPPGGVCVGGTARPVAAPGFFPDASDSALFLACPTAEACSGSGMCATGYEGQLCASCAAGYFSLRGRCYRCKTEANTAVMVVIVAVVAVVLAILLGFNLSDSVRYKFAAAMIGLNALQISAIYGQLELEWGDWAELYFEAISSFNLNLELTSPECSLGREVDVWVIKLVLTLLLPIAVAACLALVAGGAALLASSGIGWLGRKSVREVGNAYVRTLFQTLVLLYLPLSSAAFRLFDCRRNEAGSWVLARTARRCYDSKWWALLPIALTGVVAYALAIPSAVVWVLKRRRAELDQLTFVLRYGFLVGRFTASAWWFEAAIMGRKLVVVVCMTFFVGDDSKASAAAVSLAVALVHVVQVHPYGRELHNRLAMIVLGSCALVLEAGTFDDKRLRQGFVLGGLAVNVLAIVIGNALDVRLMLAVEAKANDEFFSPDTTLELASMPLQLEEPSNNGVTMDSVALDDVGSSFPVARQQAGVSDTEYGDSTASCANTPTHGTVSSIVVDESAAGVSTVVFVL